MASRCYLNWRNKTRKKGEYTTPEDSPLEHEGMGTLYQRRLIIWIIFITILFCLPPNELVLWTMVHPNRCAGAILAVVRQEAL